MLRFYTNSMTDSYHYKEIQSQTIDYLRFVLIIAVVFMHTSMPKVDFSQSSYWLQINGPSIFSKLYMLFSGVMARVAVPAFYIISGYLFFLKTPQLTLKIIKQKEQKRFHTLVIPYIFWNLIIVLTFCALQILKLRYSYYNLKSIIDSCYTYMEENGWLNIFWNWKSWDIGKTWLGTSTTMTSPINFPLWYLRDLIVISALSPLLYWLIKHLKKKWIYLTFLIWFTGVWTAIPGISSTSLFFFSFGAYMAINKENILQIIRKVEKLSYLLAPVFLITSTYYSAQQTTPGYFSLHLYIIFGIIAIFNITSRLIENKSIKVHRTLTSSVFFIYACHTTLLISKYDNVVSKLWNLTNDMPILAPFIYLSTPFCKTFLCVLLYMLLKKILPKFTKVITGNR